MNRPIDSRERKDSYEEKEISKNRPIKFRAWDTKNNRMGYVDLIQGVGKIGEYCYIGVSPWNGNSNHSLVQNEDAILMQFTGLLDKSGIEIYESDIVLAYHSRLSDIGKREKAIVKWLDEIYAGWHVEFVEPKPSALLMGESVPMYEIIGNIFENSDLLV